MRECYNSRNHKEIFKVKTLYDLLLLLSALQIESNSSETVRLEFSSVLRRWSSWRAIPKAPHPGFMSWDIPIFECWRPYWTVTFGHYCHYDKSIPWPWKYYIRHFICYCSLPLTWYIPIFVCWRPYWTPSWIVTFGHYCHYDKSIPWPW